MRPTPDVVTELEELRAELAALTAARNEIITAAKQAITTANREYDDKAFPLARRIRKLEPLPVEPPPTPVAATRGRGKAFSLTGTEDWSHEEREHFRKLAQATRRG